MVWNTVRQFLCVEDGGLGSGTSLGHLADTRVQLLGKKIRQYYSIGDYLDKDIFLRG